MENTVKLIKQKNTFFVVVYKKEIFQKRMKGSHEVTRLTLLLREVSFNRDLLSKFLLLSLYCLISEFAGYLELQNPLEFNGTYFLLLQGSPS